MKYSKKTPLLNIDGTQIKENGIDVTFGQALITALTVDANDPPTAANPTGRISGEEKNRRFLLAIRIQSTDDEFDMTLADAALAERAVAIFPPIYVGRCYEILNKKSD